jgi:ABC-type antimicrobial peptide transport system permease subunit
MIQLVRAELLKLRTTQVWFWMLLLAIAVGVLAVVATLASNDVKSPADVPLLFANANGAIVTAFILGVLGITTEFRYQTITPTVLQTPSRRTVVAAKLLSYAIIGLAYALACLAVQLMIALPWLSAKGIDFSLSDPDLRRAIFGFPVIFLLFAIMGIGVGALLRNQIVAMVVGLVFLLALENILVAIPKVRNAYPYLPGGAMQGVLYPPDKSGPDGVDLFGTTGSLLVLLAWALIPALVGAAYTLTRDIT